MCCAGSHGAIHRCPATLWSPCRHPSPSLVMKARGRHLVCPFSLLYHRWSVLFTFTGSLLLLFSVPPEILARTVLAFLVTTSNLVCSVTCGMRFSLRPIT